MVGYDLVFRAEWLESLGYISWHFKNKIMKFHLNGCNYRLVGLHTTDAQPSPTPSMTDLGSLVASIMQALSSLGVASLTPPLIEPLLTTYSYLFTSLTGLPLPRAMNH